MLRWIWIVCLGSCSVWVLEQPSATSRSGGARYHPKNQIDGEGFVHAYDAYRLRRDASGALLDPGAWQIVNWLSDSAGAKTVTIDANEKVEFKFDRNRDGTVDATIDAPRADLVFENRFDDGRIVLSASPQGGEDGDKHLAVLADRFVDGLEESAKSTFNGMVVASRYAAHVVRRDAMVVAGMQAERSLIDLVDLGERGDAARETKLSVALVLFRTPMIEIPMVDEHRKPGMLRFTYLVTALCVNKPARFSTTLTGFEALLGRLMTGQPAKGPGLTASSR